MLIFKSFKISFRLVVFGGYGPEPIAELHIINGKYDVDLNSVGIC